MRSVRAVVGVEGSKGGRQRAGPRTKVIRCESERHASHASGARGEERTGEGETKRGITRRNRESRTVSRGSSLSLSLSLSLSYPANVTMIHQDDGKSAKTSGRVSSGEIQGNPAGKSSSRSKRRLSPGDARIRDDAVAGRSSRRAYT